MTKKLAKKTVNELSNLYNQQSMHEAYIVNHLELGAKICYDKRKMTTSPYSNDLRKKVINYLNQGKSQKEASEVFGIHRNTLSRWETRYRKEGSYAARPRLGRKSKLSYSEVELFVQDNPDTKLSNIGSKFAISAWHAWVDASR